MGLKYYSEEFNNSDNILPLYANTCGSYNKKHQSRSSPSEIYTSIQNHDDIIYHLEQNIYANISKQPTDISNDATYASLMNTTSIIPPSNKNSQTLDDNTNNQIYENLNLSLSNSKTITSSSSSHIYINLKPDEDKLTSSPKLDQKEDIQLSTISPIEIKQVDIETNILEKCSKTKTKQTIKKFEVNMVPSCSDKSDLYRTKISSLLRQRRTLHRPRRYRRRSSTPFRVIVNSNAMRRQQQHANSTTSVHHPIISNKRPANKSVSNRLYNEIQQAISSNTGEIFEYPIQFHQIVSWYPKETSHEEELIPQVFSTSENGESVQQDETTTEEEEEELCPHNTFEDFLLRRRPKSSCSTLASVTNMTISEEIPVRPPPLNPRSPDIALSLDKKDVDFIHDIIHRTHGDQRVSNRITALREAYIRAANKRNDLLKLKQISQINENKTKKKVPMKRSISASKIRDELEKYDELPVHRRPIFNDDDDDDDYDETYSANDDYRYHHRRLPRIPSTTDRIINFITTLKRQLQKNFHEIRSRILIELMSNSRHTPTFHNSSRRHRSRPNTRHNMIRRTNSHHSIEHSYPFHRHQYSRTHSSTSQKHSYHSPSFDKHLPYRPRTFRITPQLPQRRKMS